MFNHTQSGGVYEIFKLQILLLVLLGLVLSDMIYYRYNALHLYETALHLNKNPYFIHVDLDDYKMYVFKNGEVIKTYPVSGGRVISPSPLGTWTIISKADWEKVSGVAGWDSTSLGANSNPRNRRTLVHRKTSFPWMHQNV